MTSVPPDLDLDENRAVLAYLADKSAHSDIAEALYRATERLGDATYFCPDPAQYGYVAAHTGSTIFAFASGMNTIAFRLPASFVSRALASGGSTINDLAGWAGFELFRSDWPSVDTRFWATQAYVWARDGDNNPDATVSTGGNHD